MGCLSNAIKVEHRVARRLAFRANAIMACSMRQDARQQPLTTHTIEDSHRRTTCFVNLRDCEDQEDGVRAYNALHHTIMLCSAVELKSL